MGLLESHSGRTKAVARHSSLPTGLLVLMQQPNLAERSNEQEEEATYCKEAFDVYAVKVGLDFWYAAACCQRLYKCYKGACHNGISYADTHKCGKWGPKPS